MAWMSPLILEEFLQLGQGQKTVNCRAWIRTQCFVINLFLGRENTHLLMPVRDPMAVQSMDTAKVQRGEPSFWNSLSLAPHMGDSSQKLETWSALHSLRAAQQVGYSPSQRRSKGRDLQQITSYQQQKETTGLTGTESFEGVHW
ncbi:uncharacterized protein LOC110292153 isoform X2 [Mus caroli]|uniref:Uncharacterized protein LOC110292153 isoform X2 n=1 Tax=Mus caroli TaxID=10089 RepID=A0A6P7R6F7_MUSCR|nr:uncharacterized protein LOC110292153 isoform X2 [Mus caroli]